MEKKEFHRGIIDYDSYFNGPTISVTIRKYQVLGIYRKITENYKRTKCRFARSVVHPYLEHCIVHILSSQKDHVAEKEIFRKNQ